MDIQKQVTFEKFHARECNCDYEDLKRRLDRYELLTGHRYPPTSPRHEAWLTWCAAWDARAQAVPAGFVLVSEDQAKDTERLNFLLGGNRYIRTIVQRDIQNEDYEKIGEHHLFTEVYWIDGWDYHENTSSDTERGSIDKAIFHAKEHCHG